MSYILFVLVLVLLSIFIRMVDEVIVDGTRWRDTVPVKAFWELVELVRRH